MAFSEFKATECVLIIKRNGATHGPFKAAFSRNIIRVFGQAIEVDDGDSLQRPGTNGNVEIYTVEKATFVRGISVSLDNWKMVVRKEESEHPACSRSADNSTGNSTGIQFREFNLHHFETVIHSLISAIDDSGADGEGKAEAKMRLQAFLGHPVVSAVLGTAADVSAKTAAS